MGRPRVEQPLVTTSLRFDAGMAAELDAWAKENGNMPRAAAIRLAVQRLLRGPKLGK